jgi:hypothetical protein
MDVYEKWVRIFSEFASVDSAECITFAIDNIVAIWIIVQKPTAVNGSIKQTTFGLLDTADRSTYSRDFLEVVQIADLYCLRVILYLLRKVYFPENILCYKSKGREGKDQKSKI